MTTRSTLRRAAATTVLAGTAVLVAAPAYAGALPAKPGPVDYGSLQNKANHDVGAVGTGTNGTTGLAPHVKAQVERMERAMQDQQPAPRVPADTSSDSSSTPVIVLALIGGGLVAGAAGYSVYRFRHHGPVGAVTA